MAIFINGTNKHDFININEINNPYFNPNAFVPGAQITIKGYQGDDDITGGVFSDDTIYGNQGNDFIVGSVFGNDHLYGGLGNDILMGFFGHNALYGDEGNDKLYGNMVVAGTSTDPLVIAPGETIFDSNALHGGKGDDMLFGIFGTAYATVFSDTVYDNILNGSQLFGGEGADQLYGVFQALYVTLENTTGIMGGVNRTNLPVSEIFLDGGSGNDLLIGSAQTWHVELTNVAADFLDHFPASHLIGGSGNDTLIGGVDTFTVIANNCSGNNIHNFASDRLEGGSGNDFLIGDIRTIDFRINGGSYNQEDRYGDDILNGGSGADILVGDVLNFAHADSIQFFGNDTFVFSISGHNGNDVVKDMNAGGVYDTLSFSGAPSVAAVDAASTLSNSGGHVLMSFAGGSILFENIAWSGQHSVLDITPNVVVA